MTCRALQPSTAAGLFFLGSKAALAPAEKPEAKDMSEKLWMETASARYRSTTAA